MSDVSIGKPDLKPGAMRCVSAGGKVLALANIGGKYYCVENECTHAGGPLCEGSIDEKKVGIACQWHGSVFDAKSGKVLNGPAIEPVKSYKVTEKNGELFVSL